MGNLVFGSAERPGYPIDAAEIPVVRDNDGAIGQRARPTERSEKNTQTARHSSTGVDPVQDAVAIVETTSNQCVY